MPSGAEDRRPRRSAGELEPREVLERDGGRDDVQRPGHLSPDPRSGIDRQTGEWKPAFPGQRPPFKPGVPTTLTHGAYATMTLAPRAAELAEAAKELAPVLGAEDEPAVQLLGFALARVEAASAALEGARLEDRVSLSTDARRWTSQALRLLESFGMTPAARAKLGLDVARAKVTTLTLARLVELADEESAA